MSMCFQAAAAVVGALFCAGVACGQVEIEPNNTLLQASSLGVVGAAGTSVTGSLMPAGDADYFAFTIPAIGAVSIETFDGGGAGSCATIDTIVFLFDSLGSVIASNNDSGVNACSKIDGAVDAAAAGLGAETYFVGVVDFGGNDEVPAYTLRVTFTARPATSGACCVAGEVCRIAEPAACAGNFRGAGTSCGPVACPNALGACCDAATGRCAVIAAGACMELGLAARGEGTACSAATCVVTTGACCAAEQCFAESAAACASRGGRWEGAGTTCVPSTRCCRADFDGSGTVAVGDLLTFVQVWFAGCP